MREILTYLGKQYSEIDDKARLYITDHTEKKSFNAGGILLKKGAMCHHVWFIETGLLLACEEDPENPLKVYNNWFMKENDIATSVVSFFMDQRSEETIKAWEDTTVYAMSKNDLFAGLAKHPSLTMLTLKITVGYYCQSRLMEKFLRMRSIKKIHKFLLDHHPDLLQRLTNKELAAFAGVSEPTYNKHKYGNEKQGE
jgi:CRP-like cAMP-binding protein